MIPPRSEHAARFRRKLGLLWFGQVLSAIGDRFHEVALVWISVEMAGERAGWVIAAGSAGRLLFGLPGGVYADRLDRQHVMLACDIVRALAVVSLVWIDLSRPESLVVLGLVAFVVGGLDSFFQPALQASLPALAPDARTLQTANAWLDITRRLALAVGPGATGALLVLLPLRDFFALDAASFLLSAIAIALLGRGYAWKPGLRPPAPMAAEIFAAGRAVLAHSTLACGILQNVIWNLTLTPALTLGAALLVREELGAGPEWLGYVLAAYGVGNVSSNLVLTRLHPSATGAVMHVGGLIAALGWLAFAFTRSPIALLGVTALAAVGGPMADLMLLRMIQGDFGPEWVGRVYSFRFTLSRSAAALGLTLAPFVYKGLGTRGAIAAGGCILGGYASMRLITEWRRPSRT